LRYLLVYAAVLSAIFVLLNFLGRQSIDRDVKTRLEHEFQRLEAEFERGGVRQLTQLINERYPFEDEATWIVFLADPQGARVAGNLESWPSKEEPPLKGTVQGVWLVDDLFSHDLFHEDPFLPVLGKRLANGHALVLALATPQPAKLQEFADYLFEASVIALLISLTMGVLLGRTLLKQVDAIRQTAKMIVNGDLSQRIPLGKRNDEFTELARQLNAMLHRIEQLVKGMREITDNVAHDLRSPLTRLKSRFELILLEVRSPDEYRQAIVQGNEELGELLRTFESLLKIAQAESGSLPAQVESFDVAEVAAGLVELYGPVMEEQGLSLKFATPLAAGGDFEMVGSRLLVAQALNNVFENASKYTPSPGSVEVGLRATSEAIELTVRDSGPGIPPSEREHVLERFVRLGSSGRAPGNGLGLSLVRAVCHLHHATLSLSDGNPGLLISMRFPRRPL
ncbi:MAG: ATP-binding protein, partial [Candidatus Tectomicrobia bacterium]|nr:ATP-binding protein [Candidatus Tectomicrobia bacterium]